MSLRGSLAILAEGPPPGPASALGLTVAAAVVVVDQTAKQAAEAWLPDGTVVDLLPFLALYRTYNTGIAFSLLAGHGGLLLLAGTLAVTVAVLWLWVRSAEGGRLAATGYALIIGGAIGNLIDRALHGHVIDYLLLHAGGRPVFVFNLADAALTLGPSLLVALYLLPGGPAGPATGGD